MHALPADTPPVPLPRPPQQINQHQADFLRMVMEAGDGDEDDDMVRGADARLGLIDLCSLPSPACLHQ